MIFLRDITNSGTLDSYITLSKWVGWNLKDVKDTLQLKFTYFLYMVFAVSWVLVPGTIEMIDIYRAADAREFDTVFSTVGVVDFAIANITLFGSFLFNHSRIIEFIATFEEAVNHSYKYAPEISDRILSKNIKFTKTFIFGSVISFLSIFMTWFIPSICYVLYYYPDVQYNKIPFAYGAQDYGFDRSKPEGFWFIMAVQFFHGVYTIVGVSFAYTFIPGSCILLLGQLGVLRAALGDTKYEEPMAKEGKNIIESRSEADFALDFERKKDHNALNRLCGSIKLSDCIEHHQLILRLLREMKQIIAPYMFVIVMVNIFSLANFGVTIAMFDKNLFQVLSLLAALVYLLLLLFVSVWYMTAVRSEFINAAWNYFSLVSSMEHKLKGRFS